MMKVSYPSLLIRFVVVVEVVDEGGGFVAGGGCGG